MENWSDEILGSLDSIQRAEPRDGLFEQITDRIDARKRQNNMLSMRQWIAAAAGILLIIGLNAFSIGYYFSAQASTESVNSTYQLISDFNIYE